MPRDGHHLSGWQEHFPGVVLKLGDRGAGGKCIPTFILVGFVLVLAVGYTAERITW